MCVGLQGDWVEEAKAWGECANDDISCPDMYVAVPLTPCSPSSFLFQSKL